MKLAARSLFVLITLAATLAYAQTLHHFDHIIIVFQENRTPDNLFGSVPSVSPCNTDDPFEAGVDVRNCVNHYGVAQYFQPLHLNDAEDPGHFHGDWLTECNANSSGACQMDGTCGNAGGWQKCYSYVYRADVQPYFDIATSYGFANYMFQTNQGPSFPAHQFIFAGTSAPVPYNDPSGQWTWFVADNPQGIPFAGDNAGCTTLVTQPNEFARTIDPIGTEKTSSYCSTHQGTPYCLRTCYERAPSPYNYGSLGDLLNANGFSWKYYTPTFDPTTENIHNGLWVAPIAINHFCQAGYSGNNYECLGLLPGGQYYSNMRYETKSNPYPIVDDINGCHLAAVSWAIPDRRWSDHGAENNGTGPAYVANIVNAVGNSNCDGGAGYWKNTAIFITWDDWGGFADHVPPFANLNQQNCNQWGCNYVYGFRVPMLVVSAYTPAGYVSGALPPNGNGEDAVHTHDFGSILAFIENNFLGFSSIGTIGPPQYKFADAFAPDNVNGNIPLSDFFPNTQPRNFAPITIPSGYDASYFQNYFVNNPSDTPDGPDSDD
jgi:phospholipase C